MTATDIRPAELSNLGTPHRTIAVPPRGRSRLRRVKLRHPGEERPPYDAILALELLASTVDDPSSKHDLLVVLDEYRYALHATVAALLAHVSPVTHFGPAKITVTLENPTQQ
jgi:hypothetical protein